MRGFIDELYVYDRALSDNEAKSLYEEKATELYKVDLNVLITEAEKLLSSGSLPEENELHVKLQEAISAAKEATSAGTPVMETLKSAKDTLTKAMENYKANQPIDLEINTEEEPSTTTTCSNSLDWKFMSNVKRHIEENMDNPDFTVDVLCSLLNMSRTSFYSKLKALTGQAPADFVRNIRLKHAAELLKEGKYSVTEVAERTGFCDGKYFREVFKKYFNVSPSQYAKGDTPRSPKGEGE